MQQFQNGVYYTPGKKVLTYFIVSSALPIIIVFVLICIGLNVLAGLAATSSFIVGMLPFAPAAIATTGIPIVALIGVVICLIILISAWIEYASTKFMFDDFAFHIQHGIISKSEIAIPYRQVQNVNHEQTFNEKMWGIARVIVETAGTDDVRSAESDGDLPILDTETARALEQELLSRSSGK